MGILHSHKLQCYWSFSIRLFRVIFRSLVWGVLPLCRVIAYSTDWAILYTKRDHMQAHKYKYKCWRKQVNSVIQIRTHLLTFDSSFSTRGERHNSYYADHIIWPHKRAAHPVMFKISVGGDLKNPTTSSTVKIQLSTSILWQRTQFSAYVVQGQPSTLLFFKILKFSWPSFPRMMISTLQSYFLSWVYYDNGDCHILCARA